MPVCLPASRPVRDRDRCRFASRSPRRLVRPCLLIAAVLGGLAVRPLAASPRFEATSASASAASAAQAVDPLSARTSIDVRGGDLEEVLDRLRTRHELNLVVDWSALRRLGLDRTTRIDLRLRDVTVRSALDLVLMAAGGEGDAQWAISGGVITIGPAGTASTTTLLVYDVADLVSSGFTARRRLLTPVVALEPTGLELVGGLAAPRASPASEHAGGSLFGGGRPPVPVGPDMDRMQELIDLVQELVDPDSWDVFGGSSGSVRTLDRRLLIRQTERAHQDIAALLELLRRSRPAPVALDVALVAMRLDRAAAWRGADAGGFPRLSTDDAARFFEDVAMDGLVSRATTMGRLGEAIRVGGLRQSAALRRLVPVPAPGGDAMLLRADLGTITSGLELIVRPMREPGGRTLRTEVDVAWQPRPEQRERTVPGLPGGEASLDAMVQTMRQASASADLAPGEGLALSLPGPPDGVLDRDAVELFVIVRVRPDPPAPTSRPEPQPAGGAPAPDA